MKQLVAVQELGETYLVGPVGVPERGDVADVKTRDGDVRMCVMRVECDLLAVATPVAFFGEGALPESEDHVARCRGLMKPLVPSEQRTIEGLARRNRAAAGLAPLPALT